MIVYFHVYGGARRLTYFVDDVTVIRSIKWMPVEAHEEKYFDLAAVDVGWYTDHQCKGYECAKNRRDDSADCNDADELRIVCLDQQLKIWMTLWEK